MRWQTITEPRAVRVLLDALYTSVLGAFMHGPTSVKLTADALGLPLKTVHDRVRTLERLGLLHVTHLESRRGRPIKHYAATAEGFFVPFHATPAASLEGFVAEVLQPAQAHFNALFARAGIGLIQQPEQAGFRFYARGGGVFSDLTPSAEQFDPVDLLKPDNPALLLSYVPLRLSREDAKQLQLEMMELVMRYTQQSGPEPYLAHVAITPGE